MINSPDSISLPNCLIDDNFFQDSEEKSNEIKFYQQIKSNQFLKRAGFKKEEDEFWLLLLKGILLMIILYSLCITVYRFFKILKRFKQYEKDNENSNESLIQIIGVSDANNNRVQIQRSCSKSRLKRISSELKNLTKTDLEQVKLISTILLSITFFILILELLILSKSNNLIFISMLTLFSLIAIICNFKNNFDQIGQINLLIFLINFITISCLAFINRFNLYKGRKKRRNSLQTLTNFHYNRMR